MRPSAVIAPLTVLLAGNVARSEEPPQSRLEPAPARASPALVDYNAPDPDRGLSNHARAIANLGLSSWAVWQLNWFRDVDWVPVTHSSIADNLDHGFTFDRDELQTNFFGHPYHGGLMFTSARAAGLSFWESAPYTFLGSLNWELFAEREPPSANDLAMTTLAGIMLGEISYRLSSELLDDSASGVERLFREIGASAVSPVRGLDRAYTQRAWRDGAGAIRSPLMASFHAGMDRVRAGDGDSSEQHTPSALIALDFRYGDLLPWRVEQTLEPFEFFELYAALNLFNSALEGAQIYTTGLLKGWSNDISGDRGSRRDNNIFGFAMTYEFQGANVATYGGVGLGPTDYIVLRLGHEKFLRLGIGLDAVPIIGVTPNGPTDGEPAYNFGMGAAAWGAGLLDLNRLGELRVRSRHYVTMVLDGLAGGDYLGATRVSYEVDAVNGIGAGVAPTFIQRRSLTSDTDVTSYQIETQAYLRVHN